MKTLCAASLLISVSLTSCNTFIGMGQDFRMLGDSMVNTGYNRGGSEATQSVPSHPNQAY